MLSSVGAETLGQLGSRCRARSVADTGQRAFKVLHWERGSQSYQCQSQRVGLGSSCLSKNLNVTTLLKAA